jgi:HAD superfamily hydrolase (TIGR01509 family)
MPPNQRPLLPLIVNTTGKHRKVLFCDTTIRRRIRKKSYSHSEHPSNQCDLGIQSDSFHMRGRIRSKYMGNERLKAVIFDVDGTLVDSNDLHVEAWQEAFRKYGKDLDAQKIHQQIGKGGDQLMPEFCSKEELDRYGKELEKFRGDLFIDEYLHQVRPFPRVRELFERVKADGLLTALASSAKEDEVESHKKNLDISKLVDFATSADDVEKSKPSPDIFQAALEGLEGVAPDEAVIVGDSPWDAVAAKKAGMQMIGLLSGGFSEEDLRHAAVAEIYKDAADLLERYDTSLLGRRETMNARG